MSSSQLNRLYFVIIGHRDQPLFEFEALKQDDSMGIPREDYRHLCQFIAHAALDAVDASLASAQGSQMFFKNIDRFNEWSVSAFVTCSLVKFVLLHPNREESQSALRKEESDIIRNFFYAVYEIYMKMILNPFYELDSEITSRAFREKFQQLVKKHLLNL
ncbi:trafficking protein particle complex subunit 2-like [Paramacrobiotus metropolitanus]|uniref:trafficking protein particle complex subunit 2-like n=1 Tax=Paramacrobiotus metropolitanus TaxID=2943436 RepID=UPI002445C45C|nr:trafficking protein particle complex subunit 2-like [Paramacrobiotus metropolitanus]